MFPSDNIVKKIQVVHRKYSHFSDCNLIAIAMSKKMI